MRENGLLLAFCYFSRHSRIAWSMAGGCRKSWIAARVSLQGSGLRERLDDEWVANRGFHWAASCVGGWRYSWPCWRARNEWVLATCCIIEEITQNESEKEREGREKGAEKRRKRTSAIDAPTYLCVNTMFLCLYSLCWSLCTEYLRSADSVACYGVVMTKITKSVLWALQMDWSRSRYSCPFFCLARPCSGHHFLLRCWIF